MSDKYVGYFVYLAILCQFCVNMIERRQKRLDHTVSYSPTREATSMVWEKIKPPKLYK